MNAHNPDDPGLSKRERQKARREQKLAHERAAQQSARRNRVVATGLVVAVALAGIGFFAVNWYQARAEEQALIAEAEENLDELGCTDIEQMPDLGQGHLNPNQLAGSPPGQLWQHEPTTSGQHMPQVTVGGFFDEVVDPRLTTHNLEHGYAVIWYDEDSPDEQVDELRSFVGEQAEGDYPKLIAAPYYEPLPDDANFVLTAWRFRQMCEQFEPGVALAFFAEHYGLDGIAPEKSIPVHASGEGGVIDPADEEGPLVFPPLDEEGGNTS